MTQSYIQHDKWYIAGRVRKCLNVVLEHKKNEDTQLKLNFLSLRRRKKKKKREIGMASTFHDLGTYCHRILLEARSYTERTLSPLKGS